MKNERISTYAMYKIFRLDNEMPVIKSTITFAKFRIQSAKITYGCVLIQVGVTFRLNKIRDAFVQSVYQGVVVTLTSSDVTPPPIRKR